jgi:hypothetical protein
VRRYPLRRAAAAAVVATALVPSLLVGVGAPDAAAAPGDLGITLQSVTPAVPGPDSELRVVGRIVNSGDATVAQPAVRLRFSRTALGSRADIDDISDGSSPSRHGFALSGTATELAGPLRPGETDTFDLRFPLGELGLPSQPGVYVVGVESGTGGVEAFEQSALLRTFLPWVPEPKALEPTRLSWLWPLVDVAHRNRDGVFSDDELADSYDGGRLGRLVDIGAAAPAQALTWFVDPMLLEDAAAMADGYDIAAGPSGAAADAAPDASGDARTVAPGPGATAAQGWLARVRVATALNEVVALPYADQDIVAARRAGLSNDVRRARAEGLAIAARLLARPVDGDVLWPPGGALDPETARLLRGTGVASAVLSERAAPPTEDVGITPSGRVRLRLGGGVAMQGVLYDERLSQLVASGAGRPDRVLVQQQFLAETALLTAEIPDQRTIVIAPPRRWSPDPALATALLDLTGSAPWLTPVSLSAVRATAVSDVAREPLGYPADARRTELPATDLRAVRTLRSELFAFRKVLTQPAAYAPAYYGALLRLQSTSWRGERRAWTASASALRTGLDGLRGRLSLLGGRVTLGARSGSFPVTVVNDLDQAVRVRVGLVSSSPRLRVSPSETVVVEAQQKKQLQVPVSAVANGQVQVQGRLEAADGADVGPAVTINVRVAQYGTLGVWVTGGAALVLFVAAAVQIARRVRRRPADAAPTRQEPAEEAAAGAWKA